MATRPTSDRLRETLFNVLSAQIEGTRLLDLYSGSGAVALEAVSRGAEAVAVERAPAAVGVLRKNIQSLGARVQVETSSVAAALRKLCRGPGFDVVFLDPPWDLADEYEQTLGALGASKQSVLVPDGIVIAEHRRKQELSPRYGYLERYRTLEQGDAALSFYRVSAQL